MEGKKIIANHESDKRLISKTYKELLQTQQQQKQITQWKNGQRAWITFSKEDMQMDSDCLAELLHGIAASASVSFSQVAFRDHKFCLPMHASPCPRLWPQSHKQIQVLIWFPQRPMIRSALRPSVCILYVPLTYSPWEAYKNRISLVWINQSILRQRNPSTFS